MSDAVLIALITNATTIVVVIFCRILSHREHKITSVTVSDTNEKVTAIVNGRSGK